VRLILEYMGVKSCAVLSSSLSVRALGEMAGTEDRVSSEGNEYHHNYKRRREENVYTHPMRFVMDEAHPNYPVCVLDVSELKRIERLLWWLQRTQPRAMQLQWAE